jgi:hypothetical protein
MADNPANDATATVPDRFYTRPEEGESDDEVADRLIAWAHAARNAWRERHGLPPVADE